VKLPCRRWEKGESQIIWRGRMATATHGKGTFRELSEEEIFRFLLR